MVEPISISFAGISAISALISLWRKARNQGEAINPSEVDSAESNIPSGAYSSSASQLSGVIHLDVLEAIRNNIEKARQRLVRALKNPSSTQEDLDREVEIAEGNICAELKRIRRLNNGRLPDDLERDWQQFRCE